MLLPTRSGGITYGLGGIVLLLCASVSSGVKRKANQTHLCPPCNTPFTWLPGWHISSAESSSTLAAKPCRALSLLAPGLISL